MSEGLPEEAISAGNWNSIVSSSIHIFTKESSHVPPNNITFGKSREMSKLGSILKFYKCIGESKF